MAGLSMDLFKKQIIFCERREHANKLGLTREMSRQVRHSTITLIYIYIYNGYQRFICFIHISTENSSLRVLLSVDKDGGILLQENIINCQVSGLEVSNE